jgi:hypothetical protein
LPVRKLIGTKSEQQDDKIDTQQREMEEEAYSLFKSEKVPGFGQFDSLLIICKNVDACSVLDKTFNAVRSSGTIVIYSADSAVRIYYDLIISRFRLFRWLAPISNNEPVF